MKLPENVDILIVGSGPTGLALAVALRAHGIPALQIDRQAEGANTSRAVAVHSRTLEVLEPLGVVGQMLESGVKVPEFRVRERDRTLLHVNFSALQTDYPFILMCPQNVTEAILLDRLRTLGGEVVRGAELVAAQYAADSIEAVVTHDGTPQTIKARWLVGCDGAHSVVRDHAGIAFEGAPYDEVFVLGDVRMDWPLSRSEATLFLSPGGLVVVAPLPQGRFRIVASVVNASQHPSLDDLQAIIDARGLTTGRTRINEMVWSSRFHIQHRIASTPMKGRALLCGDAAHVHSPAGGQGMNTGIQDAVSLANPLARALHGDDTTDLTQWAVKRHQIAESVVRMTDQMTGVATLTNPAARFARNAILSFVGHLPGLPNLIARKLSELDNR